MWGWSRISRIIVVICLLTNRCWDKYANADLSNTGNTENIKHNIDKLPIYIGHSNSHEIIRNEIMLQREDVGLHYFFSRNKLYTTNLSSILFRYGESMPYWGITPLFKIEWVFEISDAIYKSYATNNNMDLARCLTSIAYLAHIFPNNETYKDEAEKYWEYIYRYHVNKETLFMRRRTTDTKNVTSIAYEAFALYYLWLTFKKAKYYYNLTQLLRNYQDIVLEEVMFPLDEPVLLMDYLINSTGKRIPHIINGSTAITTWAPATTMWMLIFFAEKGFFNKTVVAESINNYFKTMAWDDESRAILYEGYEVYVFNNGGNYIFEFYGTTGARQHTQRFGFLSWSQKILSDPEIDNIVSNIRNKSMATYYRSDIKEIVYTPSSSDLEQYGIEYLLNALLLDAEDIFDIVNATILGGIISAKAPYFFWDEEKLPHIHDNLCSFNPIRGELDWAGWTTEYKASVASVISRDIQIISWISRKNLLYPTLYYFPYTFYTMNTKSDGFYDKYTTTVGWTDKKPDPLICGLFNAFFGFFYNCHPVINPISGISNSLVELYYRLGRNDKGFRVEFININITDSPALIFLPSSYNICAVEIEGENATMGLNNFTSVIINGTNITFGGLPDDVVVISAGSFPKILNVTIYFADFEPPEMYSIDNYTNIVWRVMYNISKLDPYGDEDGDGLLNADECYVLADPFDNDTDDDGLSDFEEALYQTNPLHPDTDVDGLTDYFEIYGVTKWSKYINHSFNPRDPKSYNDTYFDIFYGYIMENQSLTLQYFDRYGYNEMLFRNSCNESDYDLDGISNSIEGFGWKYWWADEFCSQINYGHAGLLVFFDNNDTDLDGLSDLYEYIYQLNPFNNDTDDDGYSDAFEISYGSDPHVKSSSPPLSVNIVYPCNHSMINRTWILVNWTFCGEPNNFTIYVNGSPIGVVDPSITNYNITDLFEGKWNVCVLAIDERGCASDCVIVYIDLTRPSIQILHPANRAYLNSSHVNVTWLGDDNILVDHYEISINGSPWLNVGLNTSYIVSGEGQYLVKVKAVDISGNEAIGEVYFQIDLTPPIVNIVEPSQSIILYNVVRIRWNVWDNFGVKNVELSVNGECMYVGNGTDYILYLEREGRYIIYIRAYDMAGNSAEDAKIIIVDTSKPFINITHPLEGQYLNTTSVTIIWEYMEINLDHIEVRIDYGEWINIGNNTSFTTKLDEGSHIVEVRIYDKAGNVARDNVTLIIDTTPPEIVILEPENNSIVSQEEITIRIHVMDENLDKVLIGINGKWTEISGNEYTIDLKSGENRIYVKAIDKAGNARTVLLILTLKKMQLMPYVFLALILVISLALLGKIKKRKMRHKSCFLNHPINNENLCVGSECVGVFIRLLGMLVQKLYDPV